MRCDDLLHGRLQRVVNFNPRTSYEMRHEQKKEKLANKDFNPRTSYEMRRERSTAKTHRFGFQSTHLV